MSSTVAAISKADYLKKYLSGGDDKKKEKKKKSKKKAETGPIRMRIVDNDDAFAAVEAPELRPKGSDEDDDADESDRPQVKLLDCDTEELRMMGKFKSDAFKPLGEEKNEPSTSSPSSGRRRRHDSDDDNSPPRRKQSDDDLSPPRGRRHDSDSDASPPRRRGGADSDESPPRRKQRRDSDSDPSPPRKKEGTSKSDTRRTVRDSPPRKSRRVDHSPPRRRRHDDDDDQSPPRKRHHDSDDQSPPRRRRRDDDDDQSPPRKRRQDDDDQSPPRRRQPDDDDKKRKTLDGKSAGLQTAEALRQEANKLRKKEDEAFRKIDDELLGKGAKTIIRDKKTGKIKDTAADEAKKAREKEKQEEMNAKYSRWNKGVRQLEERKEKLDEMARVVNEPFARHADDSAMNEHMKQIELAEDPMLAYLQKKKEKKARRTGQVFPRYSGPAPAPNRFGIWPGYRWDGVDRSNGFEAKLFQASNARQAEQQEFYKWSMGSYE